MVPCRYSRRGPSGNFTSKGLGCGPEDGVVENFYLRNVKILLKNGTCKSLYVFSSFLSYFVAHQIIVVVVLGDRNNLDVVDGG